MRLKFLVTIIIFVLIFGILFWYLNLGNPTPMDTEQTPRIEGQITYISIGDSYTIGNGNLEADRWPNVLTQHLNEAEINIRLIANPAVSGYTVQDAIQIELPVVERLRPDFVTVLIGANDNFSQTNPSIFEQDLKELLDKLQPMLKNPKNIILITIPNYSKSPAGARYDTAGVSESIEEYNKIIKDQAERRDLKLADIFPISQTMTGADDYISDGLHPSAQGYAKWEKVIYPVVYEFLK